MAFIGLSRPAQQPVAHVPAPGDTAAPIAGFTASAPRTCIVFLRHTGCPFAEATVKRLRSHAAAAPQDLAYLVIGHGDAEPLQRWLERIGGLPEGVVLLTDPQRRIYGEWGLGYTKASHFLGPRSLIGLAALWPRGIRNRSASGTRWQGAGTFLVDVNMRVLWRHLPRSADELPDFSQLTAPDAKPAQGGAARASQSRT